MNAKPLFQLFITVFLLGIFSVATVDAQEATNEEPGKKKKKDKEEQVEPEEQAEDKLIRERQPLRRFSVGIHAGVTLPYTDIRQYDWWRVTKPKSEYQLAFGARGTFMVNSVLGIQGDLKYGKLQGIMKNSNNWEEDFQHWAFVKSTDHSLNADKPPYLFKQPPYFTTNIFQMNVNAYINISNLWANLNKLIKQSNNTIPIKERKVNIYTFLGMGMIFFDSEIKSLRTDKPSNLGYTTGGSSGKTTETVVPIGAGLKYKISKVVDLGLEVEYDIVNTDKLDAVNSDFRPGNDRYAYANLNLGFKLGSKKQDKDHLDWVNPHEIGHMDLQVQIDGIGNPDDTDGDGVPDMFDQDNETPPNTKVDGSGVALDTDGDGVADSQDLDPLTPKGVIVNAEGAPLDSDNDGVPDGIDVEPNTTPNTLVNFEGQTIDLGNDAEGASAFGMIALPSIFFNTDKAAVRSQYDERMALYARVLKENENIKLMLTGHADATGAEKYNDNLSRERSQAVADKLTKDYGVDASKLQIEHLGETQPLSPSILKVNRRVDVTLMK